MNLKITTLTPVHISTGNLNPCYVYHYKADADPDKFGTTTCYDINQLFQQVSPTKLKELKFQSNDDQTKRKISNYFTKSINYNKLTPLYSMKSFSKSFTCDVKEQMKSLNRPYIPGSSLKGAIMNAIYYDMLNKHKNDVLRFLNNYQGFNFKYFENDLNRHLFDDHFDDMWSQLSSSFICRDIYFNEMILCEEERLNMGNNNPNFVNTECIDYNQSVNDEIIVINGTKKTLLNNAIQKYKKADYSLLNSYLNINNMIKACQNYFNDIIEDDLEYFESFEDKDLDKIVSFIESLDTKNNCYMRIGNSTNYFYKSVSLFIKNNNETFYKQYFYDLFSPVKIRNENRNSRLPKPESMPDTRVVLYYDKYYLPGVIQIECQ